MLIKTAGTSTVYAEQWWISDHWANMGDALQMSLCLGDCEEGVSNVSRPTLCSYHKI